MNKRGASQMGLIWLVLIVGGIWLISSGTIKMPAGTTTTTTSNVQVINTCESTTSPSLTVNLVDKYNPGTSIRNAGVTYELYIGGKTAAAKGELNTDTSSALSLEPNKDYFFIASNGTTVASIYKAVYGDTAPCTNVLSKTLNAVTHTNATLTYYNSDGQPATAQAVGSGGEKVVSFKIEGPNNACFGNPQAKEVNPNAGIVVEFNYNTSTWQSVTVNGATKTDVPGTGVGTYEEAYLLPISSICDLQDQTYKVVIKAKSGQDPSAAQDITMKALDAEIYTNSDTGKIEAGVETEDDAEVGLSTSSQPTLNIDVS